MEEGLERVVSQPTEAGLAEERMLGAELVREMVARQARGEGVKRIAREPYWLHRPDDGLILMAGLWQWYQAAEGYEQTFAVITTLANAVVARIHDRMPAILEGDDLALWL